MKLLATTKPTAGPATTLPVTITKTPPPIPSAIPRQKQATVAAIYTPEEDVQRTVRGGFETSRQDDSFSVTAILIREADRWFPSQPFCWNCFEVGVQDAGKKGARLYGKKSQPCNKDEEKEEKEKEVGVRRTLKNIQDTGGLEDKVKSCCVNDSSPHNLLAESVRTDYTESDLADCERLQDALRERRRKRRTEDRVRDLTVRKSEASESSSRGRTDKRNQEGSTIVNPSENYDEQNITWRRKRRRTSVSRSVSRSLPDMTLYNSDNSDNRLSSTSSILNGYNNRDIGSKSSSSKTSGYNYNDQYSSIEYNREEQYSSISPWRSSSYWTAARRSSSSSSSWRHVVVLLMLLLMPPHRLGGVEARRLRELAATTTSSTLPGSNTVCHSVHPAPRVIHHSASAPTHGREGTIPPHRHSSGTAPATQQQCRYFVSAPSARQVVQVSVTGLWRGLKRSPPGTGAGGTCHLPSLSIVEVMPSGRERLMEVFCAVDPPPSSRGAAGRGRGEHRARAGATATDQAQALLPLVFHSNSQSVIITYSWEPGESSSNTHIQHNNDDDDDDDNDDDDEEEEVEDRKALWEGFNALIAYPKPVHPDCAFLCEDSTYDSSRCLPSSNLVCNESPDCADGSDEWGCFYSLSPISLTPAAAATNSGNAPSLNMRNNRSEATASDIAATKTFTNPNDGNNQLKNDDKDRTQGGGAEDVYSLSDNGVIAVILGITTVVGLFFGVALYLICRNGGLSGRGGSGNMYREHREVMEGGMDNLSDSYVHPQHSGGSGSGSGGSRGSRGSGRHSGAGSGASGGGPHSISSLEGVVYVPHQPTLSPLEAAAHFEAQRLIEHSILMKGAHRAERLNLPPAIPISADGEEAVYTRLQPTSPSSPAEPLSVFVPPNRTVYDSLMDSKGPPGDDCARGGASVYGGGVGDPHGAVAAVTAGPLGSSAASTHNRYHQQQHPHQRGLSSTSSSNSTSHPPPQQHHHHHHHHHQRRSPRSSSSTTSGGGGGGGARCSSSSSGGHKSPSSEHLLLLAAGGGGGSSSSASAAAASDCVFILPGDNV